MSRIYLDNAATSWPKPESVYAAVEHYLRHNGAAAGRATYHEAHEASRLIDNLRHQLSQLLGVGRHEQIVFGANGTDALNLAIHGLLKSGDHVVTTVVEHNSVLRPLYFLSQHHDVDVTYVDCDGKGIVQPDDVQSALRSNTRLVVVSHASNVTGALQPVDAIVATAHEHGALCLIDAAQTVGHIPVDIEASGVDLLAASGHKGLLGPLGTGLLYIREGLDHQLATQRQGGTGTQSDRDEQPTELPHKYESGNPNLVGLAGLGAAVEYLHERTVRSIQLQEERHTETLLSALSQIPGIRYFGPSALSERVGVVSFTIDGYDPHEIAATLEAHAGIQCRAGFHCAPRMHRALGTDRAGGTVRLSVGHATSDEQMATTIEALDALSRATL